MIIVPFAQPLGKDGGANDDGIVHGQLARVTPLAGVSTAASGNNSLILHGDTTSGTISWTEVTSAANSFADNDVAVFNSDGDMYVTEFIENDVIESFDILVSTAGVYTLTSGTNLLVDVWYHDNLGGLHKFSDVVVPVMTSTGVKKIVFPDPINVNNIGLTPDPRGTENTHKFINIKFKNIASVTTAPIASRVWKRRTPTAPKVVTDFTTVIGSGDKSAFQTVQIMPLAGDISLLGYTSPWAKYFVDIERPRVQGWTTKPVYSTATGFAELPSTDVFIDSSHNASAEFWTKPAGSYMDTIVPPSDWAKRVINVAGTDRDYFWQGWEYTADAIQPELIVLVELEIQPFNNNGSNAGLTALDTTTYTRLEAFVRESSSTISTFVVTNLMTGKSVSVAIPANELASSTDITLNVDKGDEILIQQVSNGGINAIADGFIRIT